MLKKSFCILAFLLTAFMTYAQEMPTAEKIKRVRNILEKYHYQPIELNEQLIKKIIEKNFELLDPNCLNFVLKDIKEFGDKKILPSEFNQKYSRIIKEIKDRYLLRLNETDSMLIGLQMFNLDFNLDDSVYYRKKGKALFVDNENEKFKRLRKWCKNQILYSYYFIQKDDSIKHSKQRRIELIDSRKSKIIEKEQCNIKKQIADIEEKPETIEDIAINSITAFYDPHTQYFSPLKRNSFMQSLEMSDLSFGMYFTINSKGQPILIYLTPGGPAWKSGELNEGDKLIDVKAGDNQLNLNCTTDEEIAEFFNDPNILNCKIKVEKVNGKVEEIELIKEIIDLEENKVNSFVLQGEKKIGYINLPSFYASVEEQGYDGCSNDVAKEVLKLRNDNIDGLILDLRNNTGGYAFEAINIAGIFIDIGPYSIVKDSQSKTRVLKDQNRGTIYDGPLAILVNSYSASASEMLAGALQDYNRALIVGSQTFGKATIQTDIPLFDTSDLENGTFTLDLLNLPSVKTTIGKFYRVDGSSHQQTGIEPDIKLLDFYEIMKKSESDYPSALSRDSIDKKVYHFNPFKEFPLDTLRQISTSRLRNDTASKKLFSKHKDLENYIKENNSLMLSFDSYCNHMDSLYSLIDDIENLGEIDSVDFSVVNLKMDTQILSLSEKQKEFNSTLKENIQKDFQIKETYNIVLDLIKL